MPPSSIIVPQKLQELICSSPSVQGPLLYWLSSIEPFLCTSTLPFFPEYTDHGPRHITNVLATAESLIPPDAYPHLTPSDGAALTLAIVLHDLALHMTPDGFLTLIAGRSHKPIEGFRDEPWPQLWETFLSECQRFSGRENTALSGSPESIAPPGKDFGRWETRQYL